MPQEAMLTESDVEEDELDLAPSAVVVALLAAAIGFLLLYLGIREFLNLHDSAASTPNYLVVSIMAVATGTWALSIGIRLARPKSITFRLLGDRELLLLSLFVLIGGLWAVLHVGYLKALFLPLVSGNPPLVLAAQRTRNRIDLLRGMKRS